MVTDPSRITIRRPDDWHVHLRDGEMLRAVAPYTARQFARAIVMPNLVPPVTRIDAAGAYRDRILAALPDGHGFTPLMTCYLTDDADAEECETGGESDEDRLTGGAVAGRRVRCPEERHQQADHQADHEGVVELASAHDLADLLHHDRAQAIARLVQP